LSSRSPVTVQLVRSAKRLSAEVSKLHFASPVCFVYNPLDYAWPAHEAYLGKFGATRKPVIFLGMNPGPFGMAQTGVPFGEIAAVRDWLGIRARIGKPAREHPKRPVSGFACERSEVSGRRLWGLFAKQFGSADKFFTDHIVMNYCPLAFMGRSGKNVTPDKLAPRERQALFEACDRHLREVVRILKPEWIVGVGGFATERAEHALQSSGVRIGRILHPSPSCPAANRNWAATVASQLRDLEIWV